MFDVVSVFLYPETDIEWFVEYGSCVILVMDLLTVSLDVLQSEKLRAHTFN